MVRRRSAPRHIVAPGGCRIGLLDPEIEGIYIFGIQIANPEQAMSEKNRRKVLKSIAAGGGAVVIGKSLPDRWAKPVVDAVVLPAHAETTDDTGSQPTTTVAPTTTPRTPRCRPTEP